MECRTFALEELTSPKYVVVFTRYRGKLLLSRHRQRDTWETQGGHIEPGRRRNRPPAGSCGRSPARGSSPSSPCAATGPGTRRQRRRGGVRGPGGGAGPLPPLEMAETALFSALPRELTYPGITPVLWRRAREYFPRGGGSIKPERLARCGEGPRRAFGFRGNVKNL